MILPAPRTDRGRQRFVATAGAFLLMVGLYATLRGMPVPALGSASDNVRRLDPLFLERYAAPPPPEAPAEAADDEPAPDVANAGAIDQEVGSAIDELTRRFGGGDLSVHNLRGRMLPLIPTRPVFSGDEDGSYRYLAVVRSERYNFGLLLDDIIDLVEVVVRPMEGISPGHEMYLGATILGDGDTILILDVFGIARFVKLRGRDRQVQEGRRVSGASAGEQALLFCSSGRYFALPVSARPRVRRSSPNDLERSAGRETFTEKDCLVDVLRPESLLGLSPSFVSYLIFCGEGRAIAAEDVAGLCELPPPVPERTSLPAGLRGRCIVESRPVFVLDEEVAFHALS